MRDRLKEIARITGLNCHFDEPKFIWPYIPRTGSRCMKATLEKMGLEIEMVRELPESLERFFIWTFVRNPYDKVVSAMTYFQVQWKDFLAKNHKYIEEGLQNDPRRVGKHMLPNTFFTHINKAPFVDFIGYFENMDADWKLLLETLNFPHAQLEPNTWETDHPPYKELYTDERQKVVQEMYKNDFDKLKYDTII